VKRLDVVIPVLNLEGYVGDAVASLVDLSLERTIRDNWNIRLIVQDGQSSDSTVDEVKCAVGGRLPLDIVSETDAGQSDALNRAFERSTAEWILWLNGDERVNPDFRKLLALASTSSPDVIYADTVHVSEAGSFVRTHRPPGFSRFILKRRGAYWHTCAMLFRRRLLHDFRFDTHLRFIMDWDMYLHFALNQRAKIVHLPVIASTFVLRSDRVTAATTPQVERMRVASRYGLPAKRKHRLLGQIWYRSRKLVEGQIFRERCDRQAADQRSLSSDSGR